MFIERRRRRRRRRRRMSFVERDLMYREEVNLPSG